MDLRKAVELVSALAGDQPAAFVCGRPARLLVSAAWNPQLTPAALELWRSCHSAGVVESRLLLGYPVHSAPEGADRRRIGLLVVGLPPGSKRMTLGDHFRWAARAIERLDASLVVGIFERMQAGDPAARHDLLRVLKHFKYNVRVTASAIGMCRETLYKYIRAYGIQLERASTGPRGGHGSGDDWD
jgi:hypothetical protein